MLLLGAVPQHERERADKGKSRLDVGLQGFEIVLLDGVHVVGKGGNIERSVFN